MADAVRAALPELARSLRGLGRAGDAAASAAHAAVFGPLLAARRQAETADPRAAPASMHGARIMAEIDDATLRAVSADGTPDAQRRAREAAAREAVASLRQALGQLDRLAPEAITHGPATAAWDRFTAQLRRAFMEADSACESVAAILRRGSVARR